MEVAGGYIARHARYARFASRAYKRTSSPRIARVIAVFRPPRARPARARCSGGGARSLPRLRARGVAEVMVMAVAVGHAARDARNARRASRIRTRTPSPRVARVIAGPVPFPPAARTRARAAAAALARSLDRAHAVWRWRWWRWRSVISHATRVTHVKCVARHARARAHHHRFARVITVFRSLRARRPARARCCGGGARSIARSLDRAHAVWRWRWWRWRSVTSHATHVTHVTRVARHARARAHHHRFARVITVFRPPRARPRRSLDRSIARSRAHGVVGDGGGVRLHRASRASHTRAHVITAHRARHHRPLPRCQQFARAACSLARSSASAYVATPHTARARVIYLSGGGCDGGGDRGL